MLGTRFFCSHDCANALAIKGSARNQFQELALRFGSDLVDPAHIMAIKKLATIKGQENDRTDASDYSLRKRFRFCIVDNPKL